MPSLLRPCLGWDTFQNVHYDSRPNNVMDVNSPKGNGTTADPCIMVLHGGGWETGTEDFDQFTAWLAAGLVVRGFAIVSVRYRLSGESPWPAQIRDVLAAIREVRAKAATWRIWPGKIGVWGFSAGAHLAMMAAVASTDPAYISSTRPGVSSRPGAVLADYGPTDLLTGIRTPGFESLDSPTSYLGRLFGGRLPSSIPDELNRASPAWVARPIPADMPPLWLRHGGADTTVPCSQAALMRDACAAAGMGPDRLKYTLKPGATHADPAFYDSASMRAVGDWFDSYLRP